MTKKKKATVMNKLTEFIGVLPQGCDEFNKLPDTKKESVSNYIFLLISSGGVGSMSSLEVLAYTLMHKKQTSFKAEASDSVYVAIMITMMMDMSQDLITLLNKKTESTLNSKTIIAPDAYITEKTLAN